MDYLSACFVDTNKYFLSKTILFKSSEKKFFDFWNYIKTQIKKRMKETKVELLP